MAETDQEYELIVALDQPTDGCSRFSESMMIRGWMLVPQDDAAVAGAPVPQVRVMLEEHGKRGSAARAGLGLVGEGLCDQAQADRAYLEKLDVIPSDRQVEGVAGKVGDIEGVVNIRALIPEDGTSSRLFSMALVGSLDDRVSVSNSVTFSVAPRKVWSSPYGGFLEPEGGSICADFLIVEGWVVRSADPVRKVEITLNDASTGEAILGIESPVQHRALPDVVGSDASIFRRVLRWEDVVGKDQQLTDAHRRIDVAAETEFRSGKSFVSNGPALIWRREPERAAGVLGILGQIECVRATSDGRIRIEGWLLNPGLCGETFALEGIQSQVALDAEENSSFSLERYERGDITRQFPSLALGPCGFAIEASPGILGRFPGLIRLVVEDRRSGRRYRIGPPVMWESITHLMQRALPDSGVISGIGQKLTTSVSRVGVRRSFSGSEKVSIPSVVRVEPKRILVASHNLALVEGAPKVLFEVIRSIIQRTSSGVEVMLVSPYDGDMRGRFEQLGVDVRIVEQLGVSGQEWERYRLGLGELALLAENFLPDLVYANVIDSFWGVDLAYRHSIPALWGVHESIDPARVYEDLDCRFRLQFLHHLYHADRMVFVSRETERLFLSYLKKGRSVVIPNAIALEEIDQVCGSTDRDTARRQIGVPENAKVVSVVGTTAYRKGQDIFVREMAVLKRLMPDEDLRFFVVGARELDFLQALKRMVAALGLEDEVTFVPETPDVSNYFIASDVMAITSRQESAPLVSLEAFAYGVPLVSTVVYGLAEQIQDGENALRFDPDLPGSLAGQVKTLLEDRVLRERLIAGGRDTVEKQYNLERSMNRYWEEICRVYRKGTGIS